MALTARHPLSIRLAQLKIEHGHVYNYDIGQPLATSSPHWPDILAVAAIELESFLAIAALPPTDARLPTEEGQPDFCFVDTQAAAVALRRGDSAWWCVVVVVVCGGGMCACVCARVYVSV